MTRRLLLLALAALALAAAPRAQTAGLYVVRAGETLYRIARANNLTVASLRRLNPAVVDDVISPGQTLRLNDRATVPAVALPAATAPATRPGGRPPTARPGTAPPATAAGAWAQAPPPAGGVGHVVEPGETLFRVAQRYGMSVAELRRINAVEGDAIRVGQRLTVVPAAGVTPPLIGGVATNRPSGGVPIVPAARAGAARTPATAGGTPASRPEPGRLTPPRAWSTTATTVPADLVHFVEPGETLYSVAAAYGFSVDALVAGNALTTAPLEPGTILYLPAPVDPSWAASRTVPEVSERGLALVYPDVLAGRPTASGEPYDPLALTASHRDLPLGTVVLVTNPASGRSTFARVADRGPVSRAYLVELSAAAATALDLDPNAARQVELRLVP